MKGVKQTTSSEAEGLSVPSRATKTPLTALSRGFEFLVSSCRGRERIASKRLGWRPFAAAPSALIGDEVLSEAGHARSAGFLGLRCPCCLGLFGPRMSGRSFLFFLLFLGQLQWLGHTPQSQRDIRSSTSGCRVRGTVQIESFLKDTEQYATVAAINYYYY